MVKMRLCPKHFNPAKSIERTHETLVVVVAAYLVEGHPQILVHEYHQQCWGATIYLVTEGWEASLRTCYW